MRIKFEPCQLANIKDKYPLINDFDIVLNVCPMQYLAFDNVYIDCMDSFSDNARYNLDIYDIKFNRKYANESYLTGLNLIRNGTIRVFELSLNFLMDFDFKLFNDSYVDIWQNNLDIKTLKPLVLSYTHEKLGYVAFNSIAPSYLIKMLDVLDTNYIMCQKKDNKIICAFLVDTVTDANTSLALEYFINAIYEMVKATSGRYNYDLPEATGQKIVNMKDWYENRRKNKTKYKNARFIY